MMHGPVAGGQLESFALTCAAVHALMASASRAVTTLASRTTTKARGERDCTAWDPLSFAVKTNEQPTDVKTRES